jgi:hypothetical protein
MPDHTSQIRAFGALGYSPDRIADLLGIPVPERAVFIFRLTQEGDTYHTAYHSGMAIGQYNVDAELAKLSERGDVDAIKLLDERKTDRSLRVLKSQLFGV